MELGKFLRHYARSIVARTRTIALSVPDSRQTALVSIGEHSLIAVLDNLVGNAIDALSEGGAIAIEWDADQFEAVIEVTDNGPGLPSDVLEAFTAGSRIRSTKSGGNGLGLLSARSLISRVGGILAPRSRPTGTSWLITLPTAESA